jgi:hypothetical protein
MKLEVGKQSKEVCVNVLKVEVMNERLKTPIIVFTYGIRYRYCTGTVPVPVLYWYR